MKYYCPQCGKPLGENEWNCYACGAPHPATETFAAMPPPNYDPDAVDQSNPYASPLADLQDPPRAGQTPPPIPDYGDEPTETPEWFYEMAKIWRRSDRFGCGATLLVVVMIGANILATRHEEYRAPLLGVAFGCLVLFLAMDFVSILGRRRIMARMGYGAWEQVCLFLSLGLSFIGCEAELKRLFQAAGYQVSTGSTIDLAQFSKRSVTRERWKRQMEQKKKE